MSGGNKEALKILLKILLDTDPAVPLTCVFWHRGNSSEKGKQLRKRPSL